MKSFTQFLNEGNIDLDYIKKQVALYLDGNGKADKKIEDAIGEIDYELWLDNNHGKHPDDDYPDEAGEATSDMGVEELTKLVAKKLKVNINESKDIRIVDLKARKSGYKTIINDTVVEYKGDELEVSCSYDGNGNGPYNIHIFKDGKGISLSDKVEIKICDEIFKAAKKSLK